MTKGNDNPALKAAEEAQRKINDALDARQSFRLEAGAGAGKTYSLVAALKRLIEEQGTTLVRHGQKVACITYTEVARNEIAQEIEEHPAILVNTIHGFSWAFLRPFQKALRELIGEMEDKKEKIEQGGGIGSQSVEYDMGFFGVDENRISLSHDDIPNMMAKFLQREKFRLIFSKQFPVIFIDEYQDTHRQFMEAITEYFLKPTTGPLVGLFGDHWQTIYRSEYELAKYPIKEIGKGSNFRSTPAIVNVLNKLRPELYQEVHSPEAKGEARFFHTNNYKGERTNDRHSKEDLLPDLARKTRVSLITRLQAEGWDLSKTKVLMLTHNVLAAEQGYPGIVEIFNGRNDLFAKKEDPVIKFFAENVEPMCEAYCSSRYGDMFRIYGSAPAITKHQDKDSWRRDMDILKALREEGTIGQVIDHLKATRRPAPPDRVLRRDEELNSLDGAPVPEGASALKRYSNLRDVPYKEVIEIVRFIEKQTAFATQHSVKGAEFENVLVVLGGGWNHYNWPLLLELIKTKALTEKNTKGFYRARNLFYVSLSRPMVRLAVLATQTMSDKALESVEELFGSENVEGLVIS
ncbi:UvrD-helicase domain-containing protein [Serratia bockelmannii]|uniref:DNA 3'-5' helicase II n=1 Tax=Serratia bockelmannii TaxID=2703793 RepID=A0ABT8LRZ7_9GAMM|nr:MULTISPECIES: UvrD-helicase domain-containing protein [Serratia]MBH2796735.1 UvrD-helicase domain-containing protein [Serratia marcescens]MDN6880062.1 UvrD-helicase domain-containing protein [Serratia bockelmannii]HBH6889044.1 UvrD-helicase domain-containing protein [Serratia marcescens]